MTIDWLLILVIAILVTLTYVSYRRGFVKSALSMTLFIITIILVNIINPFVTDFIMEQTPVYDNIKKTCMEIYTPEKHDEIASIGTDEEIINSYPIADILKENILKDNTPENYQLFDVTEIQEYIAAYIAKTIISCASYIISFILVSIALRMLATTLDVLMHLPVLKEINQTVGAVLGFAEGLIIVWLLFLVAEMLATTAFGISVHEQINGNPILKFISDYNILLQLIM